MLIWVTIWKSSTDPIIPYYSIIYHKAIRILLCQCFGTAKVVTPFRIRQSSLAPRLNEILATLALFSPHPVITNTYKGLWINILNSIFIERIGTDAQKV